MRPADGDEATLGKEDADVAIFDLITDQRSRLGRNEHVVGIEFDLGRLDRAHRIFDGKLMETEDLLKLPDLLAFIIDDVDPDETVFGDDRVVRVPRPPYRR